MGREKNAKKLTREKMEKTSVKLERFANAFYYPKHTITDALVDSA